MSKLGTITRRGFLGLAALAAGGFAVGYYFYKQPFPNPLEDDLAEGEATFNPFVKIASDDTITIIVPRAEMGQGVTTTLAALVAEELDASLESVVVEHGPAASAYANIAMLSEAVPFPRFDQSTLAELARSGMAVVGKYLAVQGTGGSSSAVDAYEKMRMAGAAARETLKAAAATRLGVNVDRLTTENGRIVADSGESLSYGDLAAEAAALPVPQDVQLRPQADWKLLGKSLPRTDMLAKVTGAPIFGVDVTLPDMVFATVRMNPHLGGKMHSMDASAAEAMPGVIKVVPLESYLGSGYAVIARSTWHAFRAADAVVPQWAAASYPDSQDEIWSQLEQAVAAPGGSEMRDDGNVDTEFADAPQEHIIEAEYRVPFLAHATMEPMNATAQLRDGVLDIWAPNQVPTLVRTVCARELGLAEENCRVHTTYLGGGFGRRLEVDYALYAALLARETEGRPVKVIWTREEDTTHDMYRPAALGRFRARLGEDGFPQAVEMRIAAPSVTRSFVGRLFPSLPMMGSDPTIVDGSYNQPYTIPSYRVTGIVAPASIPVASWRSVGNSYNGFFHECFMDEIAVAGGKDPIELRRKLMAEHRTAIGVIDRVAEMADWGVQLPEGRARGFAFTYSFGSWVAEIVEVADTPAGIRIEKVWIAADLGLVLDPAIVEAQLISGAIYGLSSAIGQEITVAEGMIEQTNFHDFDAMRMHQCPTFEVAILETSARMGGAGEPGTPPAVAALANAVSVLKGERMRRLPLSSNVLFA